MMSGDRVMDDRELLEFLKFPSGANLKYYRDRAGLPFVHFRLDGGSEYRYLTSEVIQWFKRRQRHGNSEGNDGQ